MPLESNSITRQIRQLQIQQGVLERQVDIHAKRLAHFSCLPEYDREAKSEAELLFGIGIEVQGIVYQIQELINQLRDIREG